MQTAREPDVGAYTFNGANSFVNIINKDNALQYGLQRIDLTFSTLDKNGTYLFTLYLHDLNVYI